MRLFAGLFASLTGSATVLAALVWVNVRPADPPAPPIRDAVTFDVRAPEPPPPQPRPRPRPRPAPQSTSAPQAPLLAAGVGGLDLGLGHLDAGLLDASALIAGPTDTVMTADTVDVPPRPTTQVPPTYPSRARARGEEGSVTVSLRIEADGRVSDTRVTASTPAGVFDQAALDALAQWRFEPAQYEGRPVAIRVEQTLRFALR